MYEKWSEWRDSNPRPSGPKPDALPGCANHRKFAIQHTFGGTTGQRAGIIPKRQSQRQRLFPPVNSSAYLLPSLREPLTPAPKKCDNAPQLNTW